MTQVDEVVKYMQDHGSITQRDAGLHLDVWRLSERIREAVRAGFNIKKVTETYTNKYGRRVSYVRYSLGEDNGAA